VFYFSKQISDVFLWFIDHRLLCFLVRFLYHTLPDIPAAAAHRSIIHKVTSVLSPVFGEDVPDVPDVPGVVPAEGVEVATGVTVGVSVGVGVGVGSAYELLKRIMPAFSSSPSRLPVMVA
jgi:hypothetical protein